MNNVASISSYLLIGFMMGIFCTVVIIAYYKRARTSKNNDEFAISSEVALLLENIPAAMILLDPSLNVVFANGNAKNAVWVKNKKLRHAVAAQIAQELISSNIASGHKISKEVRSEISVTDRAEISQDYQAQNLLIEGIKLSSGFILIMLHDQSAKWRLDAVRRDFVANISHELKTPISSILLLSEAIQKSKNSDQNFDSFIESLVLESKRLAQVINDIITLSAVQDYSKTTPYEKINLEKILLAAIERNRTLAEQRNINIKSSLKTVTSWGDSNNLEVAFSNLIANAINYSEAQSDIGISLEVHNDEAQIIFKDQGIGISPSDVERIFERFYRVDSARSRQTGGTGLGLSIVKNVLQSHGASIKVWSQLGKGTTFTINVPLVSKRN